VSALAARSPDLLGRAERSSPKPHKAARRRRGLDGESADRAIIMSRNARRRQTLSKRSSTRFYTLFDLRMRERLRGNQPVRSVAGFPLRLLSCRGRLQTPNAHFVAFEANLQLSCVHWNVFASRLLGRRKPECVMDWNRIEGNWKQFKGQAKEKWGRLTDDDLDVINGRQDQLEGKIQERYGLAKDQAKKDVEAWFNSLP
jgi:uncharacterized protein YjbJ (UPF0337 family)